MRHHLPVAAGTLLGLLLLRGYFGDRPRAFQWSMATAYVGLTLVGGSLAIGPLNVLARRRNPVSSDLRRDVGIWGGMLCVAHGFVGLQVHMSHRYLYWWRLDPLTSPFALRFDAFGLTNLAGAFAVLLSVLLLSLSNDRSLRWLGARTWKRWQRWNYALFALVVGHGIIYQLLEKRDLPFVLLFATLAAPVFIAQYAGFRRRDDARVNNR